MAGLVPAIHILGQAASNSAIAKKLSHPSARTLVLAEAHLQDPAKTWMAGTKPGHDG
jgi:hypothetical protein